jgi:hypothetical protein
MTIQQDGEIRILGERYLAVLFACDMTEGKLGFILVASEEFNIADLW